MLHKNTILNFGLKESKILNKTFNNLITKMLHQMDDSELSRLTTYDIILNEWIDEEKMTYLDELKYRVTDGENINQVLLDIIKNDEIPSYICINQKHTLKEYLSEDTFKVFYE